MFGGKKEQKSDNSLGFTGLDDIHIDDSGLDDPDLLAELQELVGVPSQKETKQSISPGVLDVAQILDDDVDVELTEDDLNDPHLLAELNRVTIGDESSMDGQKPLDTLESHVETLDAVDHPIECKAEEESAVQQVSSDLPLEYKLKSTDCVLITKYIQLEKIKAVNSKRSGDKPAALDSLRAVKQLEARLNVLKASEVTPQPLAVGIQAVEIATSIDGSMATSIQKRLVEFKQAALAAKKQGNLVRAKEMIMQSKKLEEVLNALAVGEPLPQGFSLPVVVSSHPIKIKSQDTKPIEIVPVSTQAASQNTSDLFGHLVTRLTFQVALATRIAAQYFKRGQKDLALEFHKRKKRAETDLDSLASLKQVYELNQSKGIPPPFTFFYQDMTYEIVQTNDDVEMDEVEIRIDGAFDLNHRDVSSQDIECCVSFDFGWPSAEDTTLPEGKGETQVHGKTANPVFGFKKRIKITRTKPFQRFLERRKATFELFHVKSGLFGLMSRRVALGKAVVKLDALLTRCEVHQVFPVMDVANPRKATGATLEVWIRMRAPLVNTDVQTNTERWLNVEFGSSFVSATPSGPKQPINTSVSLPETQTATSINLVERKKSEIKLDENNQRHTNAMKQATTNNATGTNIDDLELLFIRYFPAVYLYNEMI